MYIYIYICVSVWIRLSSSISRLWQGWSRRCCEASAGSEVKRLISASQTQVQEFSTTVFVLIVSNDQYYTYSYITIALTGIVKRRSKTRSVQVHVACFALTTPHSQLLRHPATRCWQYTDSKPNNPTCEINVVTSGGRSQRMGQRSRQDLGNCSLPFPGLIERQGLQG